MRERTIENYLRKKVRERGGRVVKWASPGNRGVPDDIVFINGQIWFIEVKAPTGKLSKLQELFGEFIKKFTDNYRVLWSKEDIDRWLLEVSDRQ